MHKDAVNLQPVHKSCMNICMYVCMYIAKNAEYLKLHKICLGSAPVLNEFSINSELNLLEFRKIS